MAEGRKIDSVYVELELKADEFKSGLESTKQKSAEWAAFIKKNPVAAVAALTAAFVAAGYAAARFAAEIDKSLRQVAASLPEVTSRMGELKEEVASLSKEFGLSQIEIAKAANAVAREGQAGYADLVSSLRAALVASEATGVDLQAIISGLDRTLDQFGISAAHSEEVLAKLFVTAQGKTSLDAMFDAMRRLAPVIDRTGLSFEVLTAAITNMIDRGYDMRKIVSLMDLMSKQDITNWAEGANQTADAVAKMREQAERMNTTLDKLQSKVGARLVEGFRALGEALRPLAEMTLQGILDDMDEMSAAAHDIADLWHSIRDFIRDAEEAAHNLPGAGRPQGQVPGAGQSFGGPDPAEVARRREQAAAASRIRARHGQQFQLGSVDTALDPEELAKQRAALAAIAEMKVQAAQAVAGATKALLDDALAALDKFNADVVAKRAELAELNAQGILPDSALAEFDAATQKFRDTLVKNLKEAKLADTVITPLKEGFDKLIEDVDNQFADDAFSLDRIDAFRLKVVEALGKTTEGSEHQKELLALLTGLDAKRLEIAGQILEKSKEDNALKSEAVLLEDRTLELKKEQTEEWEKQFMQAQANARAIEQAVRGALQLASAFGIVNRRTAETLSTIGQVASGIKPLSTAISGFQNSFTGISTLVGAALPVVGGIASLVSGLFGGGGPSKTELRDMEIRKQNTDAIRELTRVFGEFGKAITGAQQVQAQQLASSILGVGKAGSSKFIDTFGTPAGPKRGAEFRKEDVDAFLKLQGSSLDQFKQLAELYGITIRTGSNFEEFRRSVEALNEAIAKTELTKFTNTFEGQMQALEARFRAFDITDPIEQLKLMGKVLTAVGDPNDPMWGWIEGTSLDITKGSPAFRDALAGLNLDEAGGRAQALKNLQALFDTLSSGKLDPSQLGDLQPQQFLDELLKMIDLIRSGQAAAGDITNDVSRSFTINRSITENTAGRLVSMWTTANMLLAEIRDNTAAMRGAGMTAPAYTSIRGGDGVAAGLLDVAPTTINITVNVTGSKETGAAVVDAIDKALAVKYRQAALKYGVTNA